MLRRSLAGLVLLTATIAQGRGIGATGESSVTPARTSDSAVLERAVRPAQYGKSAPGSGQSYASWHSGDRVRSPTSADVRATRQQQAPDLEWTDASGRATQEKSHR